MTPAQRWVLALTSAGSLMVVLDMLVVTTALDTIRRDLGASIQQLEWTINAFTVAFAILLMPVSALGDRFGRKRLFIAGLALFTAASAACALAPDSGLLIAGRAVQGAASAMVMPHAMALISVVFPPAQRARALGVFSSVTGLGTLGGPLVGGAITQGLNWQWIFWVNVPLGALLIPLAARRVPESTAAARRLDFGGLALVAAGVLGLVWGLVRAGAAGWTSPEVTGALATGAVLTAAFVVWELRTREPMLPMGFFRSPAFSAGNASGFLLYASVAGSAFFLAQFLQVTLRFGPLDAGVRLAPWTASVFVFSWFAGAMVNRVGERVLIVGGLALQAAGFGWISLIADPGLDYPAMLTPLVIAGFGTALAMPAAQNCVISAVPRTAIGAAAGVFNTFRQLGSTFGIAILAAVFASYGSYASPQAFNRGFVPAAGVAAGLSVAAAIAGCWAPRNRAARTPTPEPQRQEPVLQPQV